MTESQSVVDQYEPGFAMHAVHNIFLGVLAENGFIGLAIWLSLLLVGWRNARWVQRFSKDLPEWQWAADFGRMCQVSFVGYCVVGLFGNYEYWDYYFTIIGLLAATRMMIERAAIPRPSRTRAPAAELIPTHQVDRCSHQFA